MAKKNNPPTSTSNRFYAVAPGRGRYCGVFDDWDEAEAQVKGFKNGQAKRFVTLEEALDHWSRVAPGVEPKFHFVHTVPEPAPTAPRRLLGRALGRRTFVTVEHRGEKVSGWISDETGKVLVDALRARH